MKTRAAPVVGRVWSSVPRLPSASLPGHLCQAPHNSLVAAHLWLVLSTPPIPGAL